MLLQCICFVVLMADRRRNIGNNATNIYEIVSSLSVKMKSYCQCKSTSASILMEIKHELQCINRDLSGRLTQEERETFALLIVTTPEIVKNYVSLADALYSGKLK